MNFDELDKKLVIHLWTKGLNMHKVCRIVFLNKIGKEIHEIDKTDIAYYCSIKNDLGNFTLDSIGFKNRKSWHAARMQMRKVLEEKGKWKGIRKGILKAHGHRCIVTQKRAYVVHHIDEDWRNNDSKNLVPLTGNVHKVVHSGMEIPMEEIVKNPKKIIRSFLCHTQDGKETKGLHTYQYLTAYLFWLRCDYGYKNAGVFLDVDGLYRIALNNGICPERWLQDAVKYEPVQQKLKWREKKKEA